MCAYDLHNFLITIILLETNSYFWNFLHYFESTTFSISQIKLRTINFHSFEMSSIWKCFFLDFQLEIFRFCEMHWLLFIFCLQNIFTFQLRKKSVQFQISNCNQERDYRCNRFLVIFNSIIITFTITLRKWEDARLPLFS